MPTQVPIKGVIGTYTDQNGQEVKGVQLIDVAMAIHAAKLAGETAIEVPIDSPGGDCDLGYEIYELLVNCGLQVTTIIVGECCSIATVILFAGSIRTMAPTGKPPMIHNPWTQGISGDADQISLAAAQVQAEEDKLIKFYNKNTGIDKNILDSLMKAETYLTPEQAFQFKFLTTQPATFKAVAFKKTNDMSNKILAMLGEIQTKLGMKPQETPAVKALDLTTDDGAVLTTNSAGDVPVVGDTVVINGAPAPDGTYMITDKQMSIVVAGGVIMEVLPITPTDAVEQSAETVALKAENDALKAKVTALEATAKTTETAQAELEKTVLAINNRMKTYVPPARVQAFNKGGAEGDPTPSNKLEKMKERKSTYKTNKK